MSTTTRTGSGAILGRILALLIAIALAAAAYMLWKTNIEDRPPAPTQAEVLGDVGTPEAVEACLSERLAEIDRLAEEGLMAEEQAGLSRARARTLCVQRN